MYLINKKDNNIKDYCKRFYYNNKIGLTYSKMITKKMKFPSYMKKVTSNKYLPLLCILHNL